MPIRNTDLHEHFRQDQVRIRSSSIPTRNLCFLGLFALDLVFLILHSGLYVQEEAAKNQAKLEKARMKAQRRKEFKNKKRNKKEAAILRAVKEDARARALQEEARARALQEEARARALQEEGALQKEVALQEEARTKALQEEARARALQEEARARALQEQARARALQEQARARALQEQARKRALEEMRERITCRKRAREECERVRDEICHGRYVATASADALKEAYVEALAERYHLINSGEVSWDFYQVALERLSLARSNYQRALEEALVEADAARAKALAEAEKEEKNKSTGCILSLQ